MLLKFHHPPSPHAAASAWTVGDAVRVLRTANQCWSRLHRKASSLVGLTSASECVVPVTDAVHVPHVQGFGEHLDAEVAVHRRVPRVLGHVPQEVRGVDARLLHEIALALVELRRDVPQVVGGEVRTLEEGVERAWTPQSRETCFSWYSEPIAVGGPSRGEPKC